MRRSHPLAALGLLSALLLFLTSALLSVPLSSFIGVSSISAQAAWAPGVSYSVGTQVTYGGRLYQCQQAHTSQAGWEPPNVPALWIDRGPMGSVPSATRTRTNTTGGPSATRTRTNTTGGPTATRTRTRTRTATGPTATRTRTATGPTATRTRTNTPCGSCGGPLKKHILVGYWHNFDNGSGFIKLRDVSPKWDVINVAFGEPTSDTSGDIRFTPYDAGGTYTPEQFRADVAYLKSIGKRVILSLGGANGHIELPTIAARDMFVNSVGGLVQTYGFNGVDIDFESGSLYLNSGDLNLSNPTTPVVVNLIAALRSLKSRFGSGFMITMAPETFYVQLGYDRYGGTGGAYLPVIHALRNDLNWLQVQNYNSGPIMGPDNQWHTMGGADFIVVMADMLLTGFPLNKDPNNFFPALRPDQVVIGLPANVNAGNGYVAPPEVQRALDHLLKGIPATSYQLRSNPANNGALRGLMAWSVNWDRFANYVFTDSHRPYLDSLP